MLPRLGVGGWRPRPSQHRSAPSQHQVPLDHAGQVGFSQAWETDGRYRVRVRHGPLGVPAWDKSRRQLPAQIDAIMPPLDTGWVTEWLYLPTQADGSPAPSRASTARSDLWPTDSREGARLGRNSCRPRRPMLPDCYRCRLGDMMKHPHWWEVACCSAAHHTTLGDLRSEDSRRRPRFEGSGTGGRSRRFAVSWPKDVTDANS